MAIDMYAKSKASVDCRWAIYVNETADGVFQRYLTTEDRPVAYFNDLKTRKGSGVNVVMLNVPRGPVNFPKELTPSEVMRYKKEAVA